MVQKTCGNKTRWFPVQTGNFVFYCAYPQQLAPKLKIMDIMDVVPQSIVVLFKEMLLCWWVFYQHFVLHLFMICSSIIGYVFVSRKRALPK